MKIVRIFIMRLEISLQRSHKPRTTPPSDHPVHPYSWEKMPENVKFTGAGKLRGLKIKLLRKLKTNLDIPTKKL